VNKGVRHKKESHPKRLSPSPQGLQHLTQGLLLFNTKLRATL
jgi:hypothetical protein